ncbi:oryzain beta chain-like isoform X1 [Lolium rigidum]|uniref:oryzain beta chain-like isoform X1 n=1 Tax=Lolium rigidum TaxID=89674 RepID=UPI001F5CEEBF|nr:oryzain beta chain-like isoform X1 [Lolium rigidum]
MAANPAAAAAMLLALLAFSALASSSAAADMSIISYNEAHGTRGLEERTEAEARAVYDLWLAENGGGSGPPRNSNALVDRFRVFWDNLRFVDAHNARAAAGQEGFRLGLNRFADLTNAEFRAAFLGVRGAAERAGRVVGERYRHDGVEELPEAVDWREKGAVAAVKNQGQCGSCWAFSAISSVESINQIVTGELVTLSEQELVECDTNGQSNGCNGGLMDDAFDFIIKNGGVDTEDDYPYKALDGRCDINRKNAKVVSIDGFEDVPENDEKSLQKAVAHQPVSVAIEAGGREFQLYQSGVFSGRCGTQLDHGVVAVGYGTENGKDYWIVRNSWGPNWGEAGYLRMERNINATTGKCGIAMMSSYPTKNGANPPKPSPTPPTPPTPPPPVAPDHVCDENQSCPAGSTCCCAFSFRNQCLLWGCCPVEGATCCKDHASCCPPDYPVCNIRAGTCSASKNSPLTVKALKRTLAKRITA